MVGSIHGVWLSSCVLPSVVVLNTYTASSIGRAIPLHGKGWGFKSLAVYHALVAQLDRALDYESRGWGFEFLRAYYEEDT